MCVLIALGQIVTCESIKDTSTSTDKVVSITPDSVERYGDIMCSWKGCNAQATKDYIGFWMKCTTGSSKHYDGSGMQFCYSHWTSFINACQHLVGKFYDRNSISSKIEILYDMLWRCRYFRGDLQPFGWNRTLC